MDSELERQVAEPSWLGIWWKKPRREQAVETSPNKPEPWSRKLASTGSRGSQGDCLLKLGVISLFLKSQPFEWLNWLLREDNLCLQQALRRLSQPKTWYLPSPANSDVVFNGGFTKQITKEKQNNKGLTMAPTCHKGHPVDGNGHSAMLVVEVVNMVSGAEGGGDSGGYGWTWEHQQCQREHQPEQQGRAGPYHGGRRRTLPGHQ